MRVDGRNGQPHRWMISMAFISWGFIPTMKRYNVQQMESKSIIVAERNEVAKNEVLRPFCLVKMSILRVSIRHGCMESTWLSTHHMEGIRPSAWGCHKPIAVGESH